MCVAHVPWCMSGSLTRGWRGKRSQNSQRMRNPQLYVSGKRPMYYYIHEDTRHRDDWRISMDWWSKQELGFIMSSRTKMVPTLQILTTLKVFHWLKPLFLLYTEVSLTISWEDKDLSLSKDMAKSSGICIYSNTNVHIIVIYVGKNLNK